MADGGNRIFATGELLDGVYEIMQLLGRGGMGQVFEAHDHLLNRRVAIKAAWPNPLTPPLRNEARAFAAFQHPEFGQCSHARGAPRDRLPGDGAGLWRFADTACVDPLGERRAVHSCRGRCRFSCLQLKGSASSIEQDSFIGTSSQTTSCSLPRIGSS